MKQSQLEAEAEQAHAELCDMMGSKWCGDPKKVAVAMFILGYKLRIKEESSELALQGGEQQ